MLKQKEYNIADSNIAMLGSDLEKQVKKAAADTEPAWDNAGKALGIQIWRIEKFQVKSWPKEQYGQFYDGDSYIVLHTWKKPDAPKFFWDVYFWLGKYTTQDEAGTAAYKTVELDDKLGGDPVQHREVQGYESDGFMKLFNNHIHLLSGGVETGFKHVKPEEYQPRLLHLKGKRKVRVAQVPLETASLNSGDVFILDNGLTIFQWNGSKSGMMEKHKGAELTRAIDDERAGKPQVVVIEETMSGSDSDAFYALLSGDKSAVKSAADGGDDAEAVLSGTKALFKLSDASGSMTFTKIDGAISKASFKSEDVFIFDAGHHVFAWIGKGASAGERRNALGYAQDYLSKYNRPAFLPISRVFEEGENETFNASL